MDVKDDMTESRLQNLDWYIYEVPWPGLSRFQVATVDLTPLPNFAHRRNLVARIWGWTWRSGRGCAVAVAYAPKILAHNASKLQRPTNPPFEGLDTTLRLLVPASQASEDPAPGIRSLVSGPIILGHHLPRWWVAQNIPAQRFPFVAHDLDRSLSPGCDDLRLPQ
ncbi:hypothetical protein G7046_g7717 [Stylonectria norvegica]|nr:hypothetical protein G7046_g7717 [Stylonectria norvegica]